MKNKKIKIIFVLIISIALIAASKPISTWLTPLVEDTNIETVPINTVILQGDIEFTIDRLEVGDNFTSLYYKMDSVIAGELLKGAQLIKDDVPLEILRNKYKTSEGGVICFEPIDDLNNLTLKTAAITNTEIINYNFKLDFINNVCEFEAEVDGCYGLITVTLRDNGVGVTTKNIENMDSDNTTSTRTVIPQDFLFYNIDPDKGEPFTVSNQPTHLRIIVTKYSAEEKPLEIKVN